MTEPYGYDEDLQDDSDSDDQPDEKYARVPRRQVRLWEKESKAAKAAAEEAQNLRVELAMTRAGVDGLTERQHKALLATLDGDITAETVRAAAEELGFVQPAPTAPAAEEQQALERMSQASAGATGEGGGDDRAEMEKAAEMGYDALLAHLQAKGHNIVTAG